MNKAPKRTRLQRVLSAASTRCNKRDSFGHPRGVGQGMKAPKPVSLPKLSFMENKGD